MGYQSATLGALRSVAGSIISIKALDKLDRGEDERTAAMARTDKFIRDYVSQRQAIEKWKSKGNKEKETKARIALKRTEGAAIADMSRRMRSAYYDTLKEEGGDV